MAKKATRAEQGNDVFKIDRIRELVELMKENDLSEVDLQHSDQRIKLRRGPESNSAPAAAYYAPPQAPAAQQAPTPAASPAAETPVSDNLKTIQSPMVGTFYSKPNPDSQPYIKVGDMVTPDTVVCTIEAMKMFNEIPAGVSGKIVAVLVQNEEAVDVNKAMFKVE